MVFEHAWQQRTDEKCLAAAEKKGGKSLQSATKSRVSFLKRHRVSYRLQKNEILHRHGEFAAIMSEGKTLLVPPLRVFFIVQPDRHPAVQIGFAVTRRCRSAVDRNRLKRLMREAYRLTKGNFVENVKASRKAVDMVLLFTTYGKNPDSMISLNDVTKSIESITQKIISGLGDTI
jgi:ribonuclease P protein component